MMGSGVVGIEDLREAGGPISFPGWRHCAQQVIERSIKSFALTIACWVIWSGARLLNAIKTAKLLDKYALKVASLI